MTAWFEIDNITAYTEKGELKYRVRDDARCWDCQNNGIVLLDATRDRTEVGVPCPRCRLGQIRNDEPGYEYWGTPHQEVGVTYNGGFTLNSVSCTSCGERMRRSQMDRHDWQGCAFALAERLGLPLRAVTAMPSSLPVRRVASIPAEDEAVFG